MKAVAKKEKSAKKRALAQVAQLQGILQGIQFSQGGNYMQATPFLSQSPRVQTVQPTLFFNNMIPSSSNAIHEDDSAETIVVPDDII